MTTLNQFLAACRVDLGYTESPSGSNCQKFAACAHHANCKAWCATWLVCKARQTGLHLPNYGAYTPTLAQAFKDQGRYGRTPRVGAFGFVYHDELGRIAHVFAVEAVKTGGYTIGLNGNSNDGGSRTGGKVCRVTRSPHNITYGYPLYSTSTVVYNPVVYNPYRAPVLTDSRPFVWQPNATDTDTRFTQWATRARVDGNWGPDTQDHLGDFQQAHGLVRDYKIGPQTLAALKAQHR